MAKPKDTPQQRSSKSKVCYTRSLKVREGSYSRRIIDKHHPHFNHTLYNAVPWINLQGQWLQQAGFEINAPIKVWVMQGCLVVTTKS